MSALHLALLFACSAGSWAPLPFAWALSASPNNLPTVPLPPWYSDPSILRDRGHVIPPDRGFDYRPGDGSSGVGLSPAVLDVLRRDTSRIIPFRGDEVYVHRLSAVDGETEGNNREVVAPLRLLYDECDSSWFRGDGDGEGATVSWLGQESIGDEMTDYFAMDISQSQKVATDEVPFASATVSEDSIESSTVRNYGDRMPSRTHAALLASANGLLTFHRTHRFCSKCGSPTHQIKAGAARKCTNEECKTSVYPRIDPASIMLITSPCGEYALLGRKKSWPSGRYSTLAGFMEVGETLEECVVRETLEESGVVVDPDSVRFVASQPWPFPRSMMVGFTGRATAMATRDGDDDASMPDSDLPKIFVDPVELEDARWFSKEYVRQNGLVEGRGSSALDFEPDEKEAEFHVPGPASLARLLITKWVES